MPAAQATRPAAATSRYALVVHSPTAPPARYRLPNGATLIGRQRGGLIFPDDPFVSAQHAVLLIRDGTLFVREESGLSGVFVAVNGQEPLVRGDYFAAGNRLLRYLGPLTAPPPSGPNQPLFYGAPLPTGQALFGVEEVLVGQRSGRAITSGGPLITVGAHACDLTFPNDPGLAPRHLELVPGHAQALLRDLSGGLGTFVRLRPQVERPLAPGDRVRVGQQVMLIEAG